MWSVFHILWLLQNGLFDYNYCCSTQHVNADQLGYLQWCTATWQCITAMMHGHVTMYHCNDARSRDQIMHGRPPTCSSVDYDERHVTAFWPIKLYLFVYKALHGLAPVYIKSMCVPVSSSTARSSLRSASRGHHLIVPRTRLEFAKCAFAFAGSTAWNSLPDIIRSAESINTFKRLPGT